MQRGDIGHSCHGVIDSLGRNAEIGVDRVDQFWGGAPFPVKYSVEVRVVHVDERDRFLGGHCRSGT
jgi:hypothetical protein